MNCLDCTLQIHDDRPAVGTCRHCGAGVCVDHAVLADHRLTHTEPLNRVVPVEPPARQLRCHRCHAALTAATGVNETSAGHRAARGRRSVRR